MASEKLIDVVHAQLARVLVRNVSSLGNVKRLLRLEGQSDLPGKWGGTALGAARDGQRRADRGAATGQATENSASANLHDRFMWL